MGRGSEEEFKDDLTGQRLDPRLVGLARAKELAYFEEKQVWEKCPISEAKRVTSRPPITVRWVDVNKADDVSPDIRSRLVARQIRHHGEAAVFAPTPPLEALRTVLSIVATELPGDGPKCRDPKSDKSPDLPH